MLKANHINFYEHKLNGKNIFKPEVSCLNSPCC